MSLLCLKLTRVCTIALHIINKTMGSLFSENRSNLFAVVKMQKCFSSNFDRLHDFQLNLLAVKALTVCEHKSFVAENPTKYHREQTSHLFD